MRSIRFQILPALVSSVLVCLRLPALEATDFERHFKLLPNPQKIELLTGTGIAEDELRFLHLSGTSNRPAVGQPICELPISRRSGSGVLTLARRETDDLPQSPEGYVLLVRNGVVEISSRSDTGLFFGCQTLRQLLEDARDQRVRIPACKITDYPGVPYRAVHLDLRFHLNAGHFYYDLVDRLAALKINGIIVELEDKLRFKRVPAVGSANSISIQEFAAISKYANERHIDVSPLVQGLGHAGHILKHTPFKHLRDDPESDWAFDALNPETYELQFALYQDAMEATPYGRFLHVGGDEVYNLGQSKLAKQSGMKPVELQLYWLNKVSKFVRDHGRTPICWDDMPFSLAGLLGTMRNNAAGFSDQQIEQIWTENQRKLDEYAGSFPRECVYMRWTYWNTKVLGNRKAIDWLMRQQLPVMGATAAQDMSPLLPRNNSLFEPIKDFCQIAAEKKLNGVLCTMWDDSAYSFETFWRGIHNFASMSWNFQDVQPERFNAAYRHRFYAPELGGADCEFQNLLEQACWFWDGALINNSAYAKHLSTNGVYNPHGDRGDRGIYPKSIELIALPDPHNPGSWSEAYKEKLAVAHLEVARYATIKDRIAQARKLARRNHYSLALMDGINEFQVYPSRLLLALETFDQADSAEGRQAAASEIAHQLENFADIRVALEAVISRDRFLKNPAGYVRSKTADLANGGIDNEWMFVHETAANEKTRAWLKGLQKPAGKITGN